MTTTEARAAAVAAVRQQQGLAGIPPAQWSYDQRTAYNKALAAYILARPSGFTATDAGTAAQISARDYSPLQDASFSWGEFTDEVTDRAAATASGFVFSLNAGLVVAMVFVALYFVIRTDPRRN